MVMVVKLSHNEKHQRTWPHQQLENGYMIFNLLAEYMKSVMMISNLLAEDMKSVMILKEIVSDPVNYKYHTEGME